jgi:hypothetical protein
MSPGCGGKEKEEMSADFRGAVACILCFPAVRYQCKREIVPNILIAGPFRVENLGIRVKGHTVPHNKSSFPHGFNGRTYFN